jgi:hypothetical protein
MIFLVLFSSWSITNLIVHGTIFKPLRTWILVKNHFWGSMVSCMMCCSVWVSLVQSCLLNLISGPIFTDQVVSDILLLTFSGSGFSYLMDLIIWRFFLEPGS